MPGGGSGVTVPIRAKIGDISVKIGYRNDSLITWVSKTPWKSNLDRLFELNIQPSTTPESIRTNLNGHCGILFLYHSNVRLFRHEYHRYLVRESGPGAVVGASRKGSPRQGYLRTRIRMWCEWRLGRGPRPAAESVHASETNLWRL